MIKKKALLQTLDFSVGLLLFGDAKKKEQVVLFCAEAICFEKLPKTPIIRRIKIYGTHKIEDSM